MPIDAVDIAAHVDGITSGTGAAFLIEGGVGTGKSWTLDRIMERAEAAGVTVVPSRLHEVDRIAGHALVADLLPDPSIDLSNQPASVAASVAAQVIDWYDGAPTLLAIDDLHWADENSLRVFVQLCRGIRGLRIGIAATLRPWPEDAARQCAAASRRGSISVHRLSPMDRQQSLDLIGGCLGRVLAADQADVVTTLCAGNPLLLTEVTKALASTAADLRSEDEIASLLAGTVGLSDLLGLDATARACLEAASVLGERFRAELALDVAQVPAEGPGNVTLDALCRLGVLDQGPGHTLEFAQPLVRRLLYTEMTPPVRMRLHARAFEALARRGFEQRAAKHAKRANLSGSEEAIGLLFRVGHAALRDGATRRAARSFRTALELASDRATPELHFALALTLLRAGRPVAAARTLERMLRDVRADPKTRVGALRMLGQALAAAGDRRAAALHLRHAAVVAGRLEDGAAAEPLIDAAQVVARLGDLAGARELADRALRDTPNQVVAQDAALCDALFRALGGEVEALSEVEEYALDLLYRSISEDWNGDRLPALATMCALVIMATGRLGVCERFLDAALRTVSGHSSAEAIPGLVACRADVYTRLGRLDRAEAAAAEAVAATTAVPGDRPFALAVEARVLLHLGRTDDCRRACAEAERLLDGHEDALAGLWLRSVRAAQAMAAGDIAQSARLHAALAEEVERSGFVLPGVLDWEIVALAALIGAGDERSAEALVQRLERAAASPAHPWAATVVALGRGLLSERAGDVTAAEVQMRQAATFADLEPGLLDRATIGWLFGAFLRRNGRNVEARRVCGAALRLAQDIGAVTLARAIEAELSVAAGRGRRRRAAPNELTAQESRVVELAAAGRSNREIAAQLWISINTVETHMQRAFAKLGVSTRAQLIRETTPKE